MNDQHKHPATSHRPLSGYFSGIEWTRSKDRSGESSNSRGLRCVVCFFFLFCFRLIWPMRIFFEFFLGDFWTNYHVILPYIDVFDTYIVTRAWNTKPCTSHSIFIPLPRNLRKLISQPNLHPKLTSRLFVRSRSTLAYPLSWARNLPVAKTPVRVKTCDAQIT